MKTLCRGWRAPWNISMVAPVRLDRPESKIWRCERSRVSELINNEPSFSQHAAISLEGSRPFLAKRRQIFEVGQPSRIAPTTIHDHDTKNRRPTGNRRSYARGKSLQEKSAPAEEECEGSNRTEKGGGGLGNHGHFKRCKSNCASRCLHVKRCVSRNSQRIHKSKSVTRCSRIRDAHSSKIEDFTTREDHKT